jgi:hypothetical protein
LPYFSPLSLTSWGFLMHYFSRIALLAERLDTLPAESIALSITITFGRRSSVAERGSHNP